MHLKIFKSQINMTLSYCGLAMVFHLPERNRRKSLTEGFIAGILFGTAAIFIRLLTGLNVSSIAFWRLIIASATLIAITPVLKQSFNLGIVKANIKSISLLGVLIGLHFILFVSAVMDTTILNATVLVNTAPIFSVLISTLLFKITPSRTAIIGLTTSFLGVSLIAYGDASYPLTINLRGDLEAVLAAVAEGFYLNYGREIREKMPLLLTMIPIYLVSALAVGFSCIITGIPLTFPGQLYLILPLIGLGILPTAIGHSLYFSSLSKLKSFETATLALLEPIGATILGIILFSEIPGAIFVLGSTLILGGVVSIVMRE